MAGSTMGEHNNMALKRAKAGQSVKKPCSNGIFLKIDFTKKW
jgi:hypothetical protein